MEKRMENYTLPATSAFSYSPNSKYIEMLLYNYEEKKPENHLLSDHKKK